MVTASWKSDDEGVVCKLSGPDVGPTWTNHTGGKNIYIQMGESKNLLLLTTHFYQNLEQIYNNRC